MHNSPGFDVWLILFIGTIINCTLYKKGYKSYNISIEVIFTNNENVEIIKSIPDVTDRTSLQKLYKKECGRYKKFLSYN